MDSKIPGAMPGMVFTKLTEEHRVRPDGMHELFLTFPLNEKDVLLSLKVLQGYCEHTPIHLIRRRIMWKAPSLSTVTALPKIDPGFTRAQPPLKQRLWELLNLNISRAGYFVALEYNLERDQFPKSDDISDAPAFDCNKPGMLQWYEVPEAGEKQCNIRPVIEIEREPNLVHRMRALGYRLGTDMYEETHRYVHNQVIITISRYLIHDSSASPQLDAPLPTFESLKPFDPANKWIMTAKIRVEDGNDKKQMNDALVELLKLKEELDGCFNLVYMDRLIFDTRIKD